MDTKPFKKFGLFPLGRKPVQPRMFQDKIKREKPPPKNGTVAFLRCRMFSIPKAR